MRWFDVRPEGSYCAPRALLVNTSSGMPYWSPIETAVHQASTRQPTREPAWFSRAKTSAGEPSG